MAFLIGIVVGATVGWFVHKYVGNLEAFSDNVAKLFKKG